MSTVAKGNQFEGRVFNAIKNELASERLGLLPKSCQIFRKKKYYSKNRKADIEIDVSIEVFLSNAPSWSFLWAIECKDYKGPLPVNDVEEFHAKIQQIAGDNVKATLVLSGALQRSALEYCRSMGIGVVRLMPENQLSWAVHEPESTYLTRRDLETPEIIRPLTISQLKDVCYDFYAVQNNCFYDDWLSLIHATLSQHWLASQANLE